MTEKDTIHFGKPAPKSVAIVAMGRSRIDYGSHATCVGGYRAVADEIWAINKMGGVIFHDIMWRMDDLMHNRELMYPEYLRWLKTHPFIVTSTAYPDEFPGSVEFPIEKVLQKIGMPYFNTTPAYALAYAIYLEIPRIHLYGCDYTYPEQRMVEEGKGCFEWLMGIAFARNLTLLLGPNTSLLDTCIPIEKRFYGYNDSITADVVDGSWKIMRGPINEQNEKAPDR